MRRAAGVSILRAMSDPSRPDARARRRLSPVGVVKAFFTHDLQLRRDGKNLHLELVPRDTGAATLPSMPPAQPRFDDLPMAQALRVVLDAAPNSRTTLRHLAAVERQLCKRGYLTLERLTLPALDVLLRQLDGLVEPPLSPPLAELRAQIVAATSLQRRQLQDAERERAQAAKVAAAAAAEAAAEAAAAEHMAALSGLLGESLEVSEATPTDFQRAASG
jgi:hypothetical protein